jgi:uracil-DNA glycosylase
MEPLRDCPLCPRLADFRNQQRAAHGDWHNAPVPSFGGLDAELLITGLAPGLQGANRTGRPFTGDYAGELLYGTLIKFGFATGEFKASLDDGLTLIRTRITNAVRCVPPQIKAMPNLRAIVALGRIAHDATLSALGARKALHPFAHGAEHSIGKLRVFDSYHCSRYNTNTRVLTPEMFEKVFGRVRGVLE